MSIEKCKDFEKDGYGTWDDSSKPTTYANMYDFMKNQNNVTLALANGLWQPGTAYSVGAVVHSPSLPSGCKATCTTAGTTGSTEPKWTAYGTTVTDGTVKWKVETDVQGTITGEVQTAITSGINSLHDTIKTEMQTAMLALFPVGTILETTNDANPSTYIGGTWEQLDAGLTTITAGTYTETHNVNGTDVTDTYVFTAGSSEFTVNGTKAQGEAKHQIAEGESASVNYQILTSTAGFLNIGRTPNSVLISSSTKADTNPGLFCDRDASYTGPDGVMAYYDTTLIRTKAGNKPHNTLQPLYGVYRFRRTK